MKTELPEIVYRGTWRGLGKMYNIKVQNGYTTIIVKPAGVVNTSLMKAAGETGGSGPSVTA